MERFLGLNSAQARLLRSEARDAEIIPAFVAKLVSRGEIANNSPFDAKDDETGCLRRRPEPSRDRIYN